MSTAKLDQWCQNQRLPQRLLLSGSGDLWNLAINTAASLLKTAPGPITQGIHTDVKLCPDDGQSIKIGDSLSPDAQSVRGLINWLNQTPIASHRVLMVENFERTSRDAMQAWLKVLEEPPRRAQFILTSQNHHRLPTTILSRVTVLPLSLPLSIPDQTNALEFLNAPDLLTQFKIIETLDKTHKDDPQVTDQFMQNLIGTARQHAQWQPFLPTLFTAYQDLNRNINRRLVLEHLALQLQKK